MNTCDVSLLGMLRCEGVDDVGRRWSDRLDVVVTPRRSFTLSGTITIAERAPVPFACGTRRSESRERDRAEGWLRGLAPGDRLLLGVLLDDVYNTTPGSKAGRQARGVLRDFLMDHAGEPRLLVPCLHVRNGVVRLKEKSLRTTYPLGCRLAVPMRCCNYDGGLDYRTATLKSIGKRMFTVQDGHHAYGPDRYGWPDAADGAAAFARLDAVPDKWVRVATGAHTSFRIDRHDIPNPHA